MTRFFYQKWRPLSGVGLNLKYIVREDNSVICTLDGKGLGEVTRVFAEWKAGKDFEVRAVVMYSTLLTNLWIPSNISGVKIDPVMGETYGHDIFIPYDCFSRRP